MKKLSAFVMFDVSSLLFPHTKGALRTRGLIQILKVYCLSKAALSPCKLLAYVHLCSDMIHVGFFFFDSTPCKKGMVGNYSVATQTAKALLLLIDQVRIHRLTYRWIGWKG